MNPTSAQQHDDQGLPDDPIATAEDSIGANEDKSQG